MYIERDFKFPDHGFFQLADLNTIENIEKERLSKETLKENHKFPDRELFSVGGAWMSGWWCWVQGRVGRTSGEISYFHFFRPFWWDSIFSLSLFSLSSFWWDFIFSLSLFRLIHSDEISYFHFFFSFIQVRFHIFIFTFFF